MVQDLLPSFFDIDNGQRDNYYGIGRLIKKAGSDLPQGNVVVKYRHYIPGDVGNHYDFSSYPEGEYERIPYYRRNDGKVINLRDVLDFRPIATEDDDSNGIMQYTFLERNIPNLPPSEGSIDIEASFFLPRIDTLIAYGFKSKRKNSDW